MGLRSGHQRRTATHAFFASSCRRGNSAVPRRLSLLSNTRPIRPTFAPGDPCTFGSSRPLSIGLALSPLSWQPSLSATHVLLVVFSLSVVLPFRSPVNISLSCLRCMEAALVRMPPPTNRFCHGTNGLYRSLKNKPTLENTPTPLFPTAKGHLLLESTPTLLAPY